MTLAGGHLALAPPRAIDKGIWDQLGPVVALGPILHDSINLKEADPQGSISYDFMLKKKGFKVHMFDFKVILRDIFFLNHRFPRILFSGLFEAAGPPNTPGAED